MEINIPLKEAWKRETVACVSTSYPCFNSGHKIHEQDLILRPVTSIFDFPHSHYIFNILFLFELFHLVIELLRQDARKNFH